MKQYRTTLDGVHYFLTPAEPHKPQPRQAQPERTKRISAEQFQLLRAVIEDDKLPQDLKDL
jgi:hypothetical protein